VTQSELRIREAAKLGFTQVVGPLSASGQAAGIEAVPVRRVGDLLAMFSPLAERARKPRSRAGAD
jgi:predicted ATP-dependent serine protease